MTLATQAALAFLVLATLFIALALWTARRAYRAPNDLEHAQDLAVVPLALGFGALFAALSSGIYFGQSDEGLAWQLFSGCTALAAGCAILRHSAVRHRDRVERQLGPV